MTRLRAAWDSFWFRTESPAALALVRIAFFAFLLLTARRFWGTPRPWADVPADFWHPVGLYALFPRPRPEWIDVLWPAWHVALALACVGLFTRAATTAAFVLGLYLVGMGGMFGSLSHTDQLELITLGVLAAARCGDAWSLDSWRKAPRGPSGEYGWPIQTIRVAITFVYFSAGIAKLLKAGFAWIWSDTLAIYIARANAFYFSFGSPPRGDLAMDLVRAGWPVHVMAASTLAFELTFPLALFSKRARLVLIPTAVAMNVSAFFFMGPLFVQLTFLNLLVWFPWHRVASAVLAALPWGPEPRVRTERTAAD